MLTTPSFRMRPEGCGALGSFTQLKLGVNEKGEPIPRQPPSVR
jgi:hypothetical protein